MKIYDLKKDELSLSKIEARRTDLGVDVLIMTPLGKIEDTLKKLGYVGYTNGSDTKVTYLEKGWKDAAVGAVAMASSLLSSGPAKAQNKFDLSNHLHAISQLESSGGKNVKHKPHSKGDFHTAVGAVGLKPVTAYDLYTKNKELKEAFPGLDSPEKFTEALKTNPKLYNAAANHIWDNLVRVFKDPKKAAYGWRHGAGAAHAAKPEAIETDPYVSNFDKLIQPKDKPTPEPVKKSEFIDEFAEWAGMNFKKSLNELEKKLGDIPSGKYKGLDENKEHLYDYTHLLPEEHAKAGMTLHIARGDTPKDDPEAMNTLDAVLRHNGKRIGKISGFLNRPDPTKKRSLTPILSEMDEEFRGKGLGTKMYEGLFSHALSHEKATHVAGGKHSTMANRVHTKLAQKHGLDYHPEETHVSEQNTADPKGAYNNKYKPYEYALKSEHCLNEIELQNAGRMFGGQETIPEDLLLAGEFLSSSEADEAKLREAKTLYEDDPEYAVLFAFGIERTEANRLKLKATATLIRENTELVKSEDDVPEVKAAHHSASEAAKCIEWAVKNHKFYDIALGGKYSNNAKVAKDNQGMVWVIKPNTKKLSPAKGIREERATQAQREAAFYAVSAAWGLGGIVPRTYLVSIGGKLCAAMPLLPHEFIQADKLRKQDHVKLNSYLDKYARVGELHKLSVLCYVLGETDAHGGNALVATNDGSLSIIDHGGAFAGFGFDPINDDSTFTPFFLRYTVLKGFDKLSPQDKSANMPALDLSTDDRLKQWVAAIDPQAMGKIISSFEINPEPAIKRLLLIQQYIPLNRPLYKFLNGLWSGYIKS